MMYNEALWWLEMFFKCSIASATPATSNVLRRHIRGDISLQGVRSEKQLADIFTKPLDESTFVRLRNELNVLDAANVM